VTEPVFRGVGVALATLFDDSGELDAAATADHARRLVDCGVAAVVVAGSTGEAAALDQSERVRLLTAVREAVSEVPVIAGTGAASARQARALTEAACDAGADAVLVLSPPAAPDPRPYYEAVAEAADEIPVLAYHFPAVAPPGIPVDALADLPVAGVKDSSGDPERLLLQLELLELDLYTGSAAILALAGPVGCTGAILALANVEPERCIRAFAGDAGAQRELTPFHVAAKQVFPRGLKHVMAERYGTSPVARMG
jgi:4-hydroxy-tetrahydrodipicolinate synthase